MRYFSSDLHIGHNNIIRYCGRPYTSVDEMNEALVDNWNAVVRPHDEAWILGDLCLGRLPDTMQHIARMNGHKILLPGNHDPCWIGHKGWRKWATRYVLAGIDEVLDKNELMIELGDRHVLLCHFPYRDATDQRYPDFRPVDRGMTLLHGHVHEKWRQRDRMINVGVDVWDFAPVSEDELLSLLR